MAKPVESAGIVKAPDLLALTTQIVAAHVGRNALPMGELPKLISDIHHALKSLGAAPQAKEERPEPAVPIKKSVGPDYIVCLEDGRRLKMLKRHLMAAYNMTPAQYRERWDLPAEYPMVAPAYAKHRSKLAKEIGLGKARQRGKP